MSDDPRGADEEQPTSPEGGDDVSSREVERSAEDTKFVPVIVKRVDVSVRHPDDTLELAIDEGVEQASRSTTSLLLSAFAAGAILAFTALAVGVVETMVAPFGLPALERVAVAVVYPIGFVLCLMSGTQLFTEHTALPVYPLLDKRIRLGDVGRIWLTVWIGNTVGCLLGAVLLMLAEGVIQASPGYAAIAHHLTGFGAGETLVSAILAGWLMALGGWLVLATPPDASQILVIYLVTFLIGLAGLHHSIAGTAEVAVAMLTGAEIGIGTAVVTIAIAVFGNLVGGAFFVGVLNYAHIRRIDAALQDEQRS